MFKLFFREVYRFFISRNGEKQNLAKKKIFAKKAKILQNDFPFFSLETLELTLSVNLIRLFAPELTGNVNRLSLYASELTLNVNLLSLYTSELTLKC